MTQHTDLIDELRTCAGDPMSLDWAYIEKATITRAADALEAQAREIERLREDAQRWAMAAQITNGFIVHPSRDDESESANAYRLAVIRGRSFTESIDAAIRALNTK